MLFSNQKRQDNIKYYITDFIQKVSQSFFLKFIWIVNIYTIIYSAIYLYFDARASALLLITSTLVFTTVVLYLEKYKYENLARWVFCVSTSIYIYTTPFGIRDSVNVEYYYIVALLLPALLYSARQKKLIFSAMLISPMTWALQKLIILPEFSPYWVPKNFPYEAFREINFLGAALIMTIFIKFFLDRYNEKSLQLEEAQRIARIGSWFFNVKTGQITWSNKMFDLFPEKIENGAPTYDRHFSTIHPDDQAHWKKTVEACLADGKPYQMRFRSVFSENKILWLEAFGSAECDSDNLVLTLSGTCQDITELVLIEEKSKLERAKAQHSAKLASLGEMAAGIAHEINNPLSIISGSAQLLEQYANNPEKLFEKKLSIISATERISKIVYGLRKFSRTSYKNKYSIKSVSHIIEECLILTDAKAKRHSVALIFNKVSDSNVECDEIEISQVFINLINNGIDAAMSQDEKWVQIKLFDFEDHIIIRFSDSGKGIDTNVIHKLFQPFFTTKNIGEGTGLGLSIAKGILDEHKASIELISAEKNTCFEVKFKKNEVNAHVS